MRGLALNIWHSQSSKQMLLISLDHNYETSNGIHASKGSDDRVGINVLIKVFTRFIIPLLDVSASHVSSQIKCSECRL